MRNIIFVICGNARTFLQCFDSCYENVINVLGRGQNVTLFFYLKLTDPGPKQQDGWNFTYSPQKHEEILGMIRKYYGRGKQIYYQLLAGDEINEKDILNQIADRSKYGGFFNQDVHLSRAMHCHYNFEACGKFILDLEKHNHSIYHTIVYVRPDIFFTEKCFELKYYNPFKVTFGNGPNLLLSDHIAIIPRKFFKQFFFDRMKVYRENRTFFFEYAEMVYQFTLKDNFIRENIGRYYIKRE
jgi:hypothetical protein